MTELHWSFQGGKLKQDVTSITLVNNTTKNQDTTVPTGKRWYLLQFKVTNADNVTRQFDMEIWKEAAFTSHLYNLETTILAATTGILVWPNMKGSYYDGAAAAHPTTTLNNPSTPVILEAGNTLRAKWTAGGASAGATDADGLVIVYLEVDV